MTVEQEVGNLTTAVTALTTEAVSDRNTRQAAVSDAQSARDTALGYRDETEAHKDNAQAAANAANVSAGDVASALVYQDLASINADTAYNAVAVAQGYWPPLPEHVERNASYYAAHGPRPRNVVIVAEASALHILDGDDPSLPVWKSYTQAASVWTVLGFHTDATVNSVVVCSEGFWVGVSGGGNGRNGVGYADFANDNIEFLRDATKKLVGRIVDTARSDADTPNVSVDGLVSVDVNALDVYTPPDAPIDPVSGLQKQVIEVGTAAGLSVILEDGTVSDNGVFSMDVADITCTDEGIWWSRVSSTFTLMFATWTDIRAGNGFGDLVGNSAGTYDIDMLSHGTVMAATKRSDIIFLGATPGGSAVPGIWRHNPNYADFAKGLSAMQTPDYATPYMFGDVKLATMCEASDVNLVGGTLPDRSVNGNDLTVNGTVPVNDGWYGPLQAANNFLVPASATADITTGDFCFDVLIKGTDTYATLISGATDTSGLGIYTTSVTAPSVLYVDIAGVTVVPTNSPGSAALVSDQPCHICVVRRNGVVRTYINGLFNGSGSSAGSIHSATGHRLGVRYDGQHSSESRMRFANLSAGAPTDAQVALMARKSIAMAIGDPFLIEIPTDTAYDASTGILWAIGAAWVVGYGENGSLLASTQRAKPAGHTKISAENGVLTTY